jgi:predicted DNA-binding transcriptional regulator AlpA
LRAPNPSPAAPSREARGYSQPRRGLRRSEAAIYIGISATKFDGLVKDGRMPRPKKIDGAVVWDLKELDLYFETLPCDSREINNPWD